MSQLLPPAATAAAAEDEEDEMAASPGRGGRHGDEDAPRPRRSCEERQRPDLQHSREERQRSGLQRGDFLATRTRKSRRPRAADMEDEEVGASLSGRQRAEHIPQVLPRRGNEGIPCDGIFTRELQGQNVENELDSTASTPPSPVPASARSYDPSSVPISRTEYEGRKTRFVGASRVVNPRTLQVLEEELAELNCGD